MNDILQQIMNMIENTRTVPSISSFSMIGFTVLLIFGVINCILGYRLLRFWMMLCGFVIGAGIGFFIAFIGLKNAGIIIGSESTFVWLERVYCWP